jgi:ABC-type multidrug transport system fused ATPase/permease subunit
MVVLAMLAVLAAQAESVALMLLGLSVDGITGTGPVTVEVGPVDFTTSTTTAALVAVAALAVSAIVGVTFARIQSRAVSEASEDRRAQILDSYAAATWEAQAAQRPGRLSGLLRLAAAAGDTYAALTNWIRAMAIVVVFLGAAILVSPIIALLTAALGFVVAAAILPLRLRMRTMVRQTAEAELLLSQDLLETTEAAVDLHVYGGWTRTRERLHGTSSELAELARRVRLQAALIPLVYQYGGPLVVVALLLGTPFVAPEIGVGQVAAVALLLIRVVQYSQQVQVTLQALAQGVGMLHTVRAELSPLVRAPRRTTGQSIAGVHRITLEDVGYRYPAATQEALSGLNLELSTGRSLGIVGASGGGKSTLAQILLGLRDPTSGRVLVDGAPLERIQPESWFRHLAHVPQSPRIIHGTVLENITFGDPTVRLDDVVAAAKKAGLHEFITGLADGYSTEIGPSSRALSGGQVQRLALARALVHKPAVLVLDEPTSALDMDSEQLIQEALDRLGGTRDLLIVIIAHRLSTLANCDDLVLLEGGHLVDSGPVGDVLVRQPSLERAFAAAGVM